MHDLRPGDALSLQLLTPGYRARPQRAFVISVEAFDWNCPQHITERFSIDEVRKATTPLLSRIAELEAQLLTTKESPNG